jgi:hypothetical protein
MALTKNREIMLENQLQVLSHRHSGPARLALYLTALQMAMLETMAIGEQKSIQDWLRNAIEDAALDKGLME